MCVLGEGECSCDRTSVLVIVKCHLTGDTKLLIIFNAGCFDLKVTAEGNC